MDYFNIYIEVLITVHDERPQDGTILIKAMNDKPVIQDALVEGEDTKLLAQYTMETLENLIEDNLIKGKISKTKDGKIYMIEGLTTLGHQYLQKSKDPLFKEKLLKAFQEEGIPMTPQSITKFIAKLL